MKIRYNKTSGRVQAIASTLSEKKDYLVKTITKTEYNKIKGYNPKQLYLINNKVEVIVNKDMLSKTNIKKEKNKKVKELKKNIEDKILTKYSYNTQINNIYSLLVVLEDSIKTLTKDKTEEEKAVIDNTYNMISEIYTDITEYKIELSKI